jgi:hypothetical protein
LLLPFWLYLLLLWTSIQRKLQQVLHMPHDVLGMGSRCQDADQFGILQGFQQFLQRAPLVRCLDIRPSVQGSMQLLAKLRNMHCMHLMLPIRPLLETALYQAPQQSAGEMDRGVILAR